MLIRDYILEEAVRPDLLKKRIITFTGLIRNMQRDTFEEDKDSFQKELYLNQEFIKHHTGYIVTLFNDVNQDIHTRLDLLAKLPIVTREAFSGWVTTTKVVNKTWKDFVKVFFKMYPDQRLDLPDWFRGWLSA